MRLFEAREQVLLAALSYVASEKGDLTSPYYDAELELREEVLEKAILHYVSVRGLGVNEIVGGHA